MSLKAVLDTLPEGEGAARADANGNVAEQVGQIDAETVCAVASMSMNTLDEIGSLLGLGSLDGWSIASDSSSLFVHRRATEFVAVVAPATKNPESNLKKLSQAAW